MRPKDPIPDDWAEKSQGFQCWVELLRVIDEENPDDEKLESGKNLTTDDADDTDSTD